MPESGGNPLESVIMTTDDEDSMFEFRDGKAVRKLSSDSHHSLQIVSDDENDATPSTRSATDASAGRRRRTLSSEVTVDMVETEGSSSSSSSNVAPATTGGEAHSLPPRSTRKTIGRTHSHSSAAANTSTRRRNRSSSRSGRRSQSLGRYELPPSTASAGTGSPPRPPTTAASSTPTRTLPDVKQPQMRLTQVGAILGATAPGGAQVVKAVNKAQERKVQRQREKASLRENAAASKVHMGFYV